MANLANVGLSIVVPVFNESSVIKNNVGLLYEYLLQSELVEKFEILVCDNGSTDDTFERASSLAAYYPSIKTLSVPNKGFGLGAKHGVLAAQYEIVMLYSIDLPFGFQVISDSLEGIVDNDLVIGSKWHEDSVVNINTRRRIASKIYDTLVNFLFKLNVKDPQGSVMFRKSRILPFLHRGNSADFFFQTEFLIYARKANLKIKEIPVTLVNPRKGSTVNILKDGWAMFKQLVKVKLRDGVKLKKG